MRRKRKIINQPTSNPWPLEHMHFSTLSNTHPPSAFTTIQATITNITPASLVAQSGRNLPAVQETWVRSLAQEDPLEKEMAIHSSILAWKIPRTEEPGGLQSMESQRVRHYWVCKLQLYPPWTVKLITFSWLPKWLWLLGLLTPAFNLSPDCACYTSMSIKHLGIPHYLLSSCFQFSCEVGVAMKKKKKKALNDKILRNLSC